jgi:hypothetical protein
MVEKRLEMLLEGCLVTGAVAGVAACLYLTWTVNISGTLIAFAATASAVIAGLIRCGVQSINRRY